MQLDMRSSIHHHSSELAATEGMAFTTVTSKQEMSAEPWQCLNAEDGTFTHAGFSGIYNRRGISDAASVSQHSAPWYPFDSFGALNDAFGVKRESTTADSVGQKPEPSVRRVDYQTGGDSSGHWQLEQFAMTAVAESGRYNEQPLRAVASVVPTQLTTSAAELPVDSRAVSSDVSSLMSDCPPPLVSVASLPTASMPSFTDHVLSTAGRLAGQHGASLLGEESRSPLLDCGEEGSDSEVEETGIDDSGRCSPPAERISHEAHRSKNAVYVATCVEFAATSHLHLHSYSQTLAPDYLGLADSTVPSVI